VIARILFRLSPALIAGACAAGACDPGNAGFFGGIGCSAGSGYQQRTATLQTASANAQQDAASSQSNAVYEQQNAVGARAQVAALRHQISDMQRDQALLRQRLASAQVRRGAQDADLQRVRMHVDSLDAQLRAAQAGPEPDAAQVQRLNARRNAVLLEAEAL
jgi:chromosome segregation ATPase